MYLIACLFSQGKRERGGGSASPQKQGERKGQSTNFSPGRKGRGPKSPAKEKKKHSLAGGGKKGKEGNTRSLSQANLPSSSLFSPGWEGGGEKNPRLLPLPFIGEKKKKERQRRKGAYRRVRPVKGEGKKKKREGRRRPRRKKGKGKSMAPPGRLSEGPGLRVTTEEKRGEGNHSFSPPWGEERKCREKTPQGKLFSSPLPGKRKKGGGGRRLLKGGKKGEGRPSSQRKRKYSRRGRKEKKERGPRNPRAQWSKWGRGEREKKERPLTLRKRGEGAVHATQGYPPRARCVKKEEKRRCRAVSPAQKKKKGGGGGASRAGKKKGKGGKVLFVRNKGGGGGKKGGRGTKRTPRGPALVLYGRRDYGSCKPPFEKRPSRPI